MTPAVEVARRAGIWFAIHEYAHRPEERHYGDEAAQALGLAPERVFKTLLAAVDGEPARLSVALVQVSQQLDLRALAAALGVKKMGMALPRDAERATGYVTGGISPLGQRRSLPLLLDEAARGCDTIYVSGGRRGLELELRPADLLSLSRGRYARIARSR